MPTSFVDGVSVIEVKKLDGMTMYVNDDLIVRVEDAVGGQSTLYLLDGSHIIVANDPLDVVTRVRAQRVAVLRRALEGPEDPSAPETLTKEQAGVTRLEQVRER